MANRRQPVILVIDDDAAIRDLLSRIMQRLGIATITASNGAEAIALYNVFGSLIDAITVDAVMPIMDGGEALYELRRRGAQQPAIAISGQPQAEIDRIFARAQPNDVIMKPCSIPALIDVLSRWGLVREAALVAS
jgi:CheY-like chemotaxis protein